MCLYALMDLRRYLEININPSYTCRILNAEVSAFTSCEKILCYISRNVESSLPRNVSFKSCQTHLRHSSQTLCIMHSSYLFIRVAIAFFCYLFLLVSRYFGQIDLYFFVSLKYHVRKQYRV